MKIAILGAGLLGRLLAYRLHTLHHKLVIFEKGNPESQTASYVSTAMLASGVEAAIADAWVTALGQYSLRLWPSWISELNSATNASIFFQQQGSLLVWHKPDEASAHRLQQRLLHQGIAAITPLSAKEILQLEPELATRFTSALFFPEDGQLDNRALLQALHCFLEQHGHAIFWQRHQEAMKATDSNADWIIDCRGLGAKEDWNKAMPEHSLRGVRGEVIRVHAPAVKISRPIRMLHPRYAIYIAPKPGNVCVIGASEIESEDYSAISVQTSLELLSAAYAVHPGFAEARMIELGAQCRPTLPDHCPRIYWNGQRYLAINGLYRHGYLIAPAIVQQIVCFLSNWQHQQQPCFYDTWLQQQPWPQLWYRGLLP